MKKSDKICFSSKYLFLGIFAIIVFFLIVFSGFENRKKILSTQASEYYCGYKSPCPTGFECRGDYILMGYGYKRCSKIISSPTPIPKPTLSPEYKDLMRLYYPTLLYDSVIQTGKFTNGDWNTTVINTSHTIIDIDLLQKGKGNIVQLVEGQDQFNYYSDMTGDVNFHFIPKQKRDNVTFFVGPSQTDEHKPLFGGEPHYSEAASWIGLEGQPTVSFVVVGSDSTQNFYKSTFTEECQVTGDMTVTGQNPAKDTQTANLLQEIICNSIGKALSTVTNGMSHNEYLEAIKGLGIQNPQDQKVYPYWALPKTLYDQMRNSFIKSFP